VSPTSMNRRGFLGALAGLASTGLASFRANAQSATPVAATAVPFTAQNSTDISVIYLGQGQLTFRSNNTLIPVNKNETDLKKTPITGPNLGISEGTFTQALAIGLDALRKANHGQFPAGATFRLVVSYQEIGAAAVQKEFQISPDKIPAESDLTSDSVVNAANLSQVAYNFFKETLCVNVAQYGGDYLKSSFALASNHRTPARVYILMDLLQQAGTTNTTNAPAQNAP
jgi:hypothetical protein